MNLFFPIRYIYFLLPVFIVLQCDTAIQVDSDTPSFEILTVEHFEWRQVPVGGGGYVTGVLIHPSEPDLIYVRTDIGGAYRWCEKEMLWIPILDWVGVDNSNLHGVDGMALDPENPDVIYMALGKRINNPDAGIYKSNDRGNTWEELLEVRNDANNQDNRWAGEPLVVDPNNSEIIYAGTRIDGLLKTTDGGNIWETISDVPEGITEGPRPLGIRSVVIDGSSVVNEGQQEVRSKVIYAGIHGNGIYRSTDGGNSFEIMPGAPESPNHMAVTAPGTLVVTHDEGVAVYSNRLWRDITPDGQAGWSFVGLAVDPHYLDRFVVTRFSETFGNPIYRTRDNGYSWEEIGSEQVLAELYPDVPWWPKVYFSSATSAMAIDPHYPGRLFFTDWFGIWHTEDIWADTTRWYTRQKGHEETVHSNLISPPEGPLLVSATADVLGFRYEELEEYPVRRITDRNEGNDIDYCFAHPGYMVLVDATSWKGDNTRVVTSDDGGLTWEEKSTPEGAKAGKVAYSTTDPYNIVYVPGEDIPYYTKDRGTTWNAARGAPAGAVEQSTVFSSDNFIASDRVNGDRFYLYHNGNVYVSENGGEDWSIRNEENPLPEKDGWEGWMRAAPGKEGEVWISLGGNGLWRSEDGARTFRQLELFENARLLGWGKEAPGNVFGTAYVYGNVKGVWGLYRSVDLGSSWMKITDKHFQFGGAPSVVVGDGREFGRVYVGTGGRGIYVGTSPDFGKEHVEGRVCEDINRNGVCDETEPGIPGVMVSNQREVVLTDKNGKYRLPVEKESVIFITKPAEYELPLNEYNLPQFYYIHHPEGSLEMRYGGIYPTGPLPESVDFCLIPSEKNEEFSALVISDPTLREHTMSFFRDAVVSDMAEESADFVIVLGDIMADDLSYFDRYNRLMKTLEMPVFNLVGNHDINFDTDGNSYAKETFKSHYGPTYYSFEYGDVHFIAMDNIQYLGSESTGGSVYRGYLEENQLTWIRNNLEHVDEDQLVVLLAHIPLYSMDTDARSNNTVNREELIALLENQNRLLFLSGHRHMTIHHFLDEEFGRTNPNPLHHMVTAAAAGGWWRGPENKHAIPVSTQNDGSPNGYFIVRFDGNTYSERFKAAGLDPEYQMRIELPKGYLSQEKARDAELVVNVFNGSEKNIVRYMINDSGKWHDMQWKSTYRSPFISRTGWINAMDTNHIWKSKLPVLELGANKITVWTRDMYGQEFRQTRIFEVD